MRRALLLALVLLAGCSGDFWVPCGIEKRQTTERYGSPERVTRYVASGYARETWWYDSRGYSIAFTETSGGSCRVSTYTWTR